MPTVLPVDPKMPQPVVTSARFQKVQHEETKAETRRSGSRLLSIDVFRGVLVAGMILVTNPGTYDYVYGPLKHADWNGATLTDMIFPSFLFLVGVSLVYSVAARTRRGETRSNIVSHIALRSIALIGVGLLLNLFDLLHVHDWRLPGVLQRIGLCYCSGALIYLWQTGRSVAARRSVMCVAGLALMTLYWILQTRVPVPGYGVGRLDPAATLSAYIDRAVFTTTHLWHWGGPGQMWDPEGLLTTLPAIANVLLGILAGDWLRSSEPSQRRVLGMIAIGAAMMGLAMALDPLIPINKKIWTPSFVFLSGGFSLAVFGLLHWLIDLKWFGERRFGRALMTPALIYGSNAILGFALANMISPIFGVIRLPGEWIAQPGKPITIPRLGFAEFSHLLGPLNASLAYAMTFVLLILAILWPLYRKHIFVRL